MNATLETTAVAAEQPLAVIVDQKPECSPVNLFAPFAIKGDLKGLKALFETNKGNKDFAQENKIHIQQTFVAATSLSHFEMMRWMFTSKFVELTVEVFNIAVRNARLDIIVWLEINGCKKPHYILEGIKDVELLSYLKEIVEVYDVSKLIISEDAADKTALKAWFKSIVPGTMMPSGLVQDVIKHCTDPIPIFRELMKVGYPMPTNVVALAISKGDEKLIEWLTFVNVVDHYISSDQSGEYDGFIISNFALTEAHFLQALEQHGPKLALFLVTNRCPKPAKMPRVLLSSGFEALRATYKGVD